MEEEPLALAYGHVRAATSALLQGADALGLGIEALDIEASFEALGVTPLPVEDGGGAVEALACAAAVLSADRQRVPLALIAKIDALQRQVA